jgi:hypothetical protein
LTNIATVTIIDIVTIATQYQVLIKYIVHSLPNDMVLPLLETFRT